jgi:thymidine kinase
MRDMQHHTIQQATSILTKRLEITPLDRRKIEAITRKVLHNQAYVDALLKQAQLLIFRGRGGTGKTVRLLQLAHQLYQEQDARVLILTYNVALVSDIKRLLHLMGIKQGMDRRRIFIQTVHAFVYRVLRGMELLDEHTRDFITRYDDYKRELLDMYQEGALAAHDLHTMMHANPEDFSYDYVMVDEAQDWPPDERDLLFAMYDYRQCVLAHGYDQLVRGQQETDWRATIPRGTSQIVSLKRSLRLKAGLCEVVNSIAEALGLQDWNVQPDQQVYGGRVIIVEGAYRQPLHATLLQRLREHGNEPIDMLCCVPPTMVMEQGYPFAQQLHEWGYAVWDGTDEATRHEHPTSVQQHRVVQYDSCRGLEGWTAVHLGFDELYNYKYNDYTPTDTEATDIFFDHASSAHDYAIRWMMIPLTRAIDTLVLHITSADHPVGTALSTAAQRHRELVDWIRASPGRSEQA